MANGTGRPLAKPRNTACCAAAAAGDGVEEKDDPVTGESAEATTTPALGSAVRSMVSTSAR